MSNRQRLEQQKVETHSFLPLSVLLCTIKKQINKFIDGYKWLPVERSVHLAHHNYSNLHFPVGCAVLQISYTTSVRSNFVSIFLALCAGCEAHASKNDELFIISHGLRCLVQAVRSVDNTWVFTLVLLIIMSIVNGSVFGKLFKILNRSQTQTCRHTVARCAVMRTHVSSHNAISIALYPIPYSLLKSRDR